MAEEKSKDFITKSERMVMHSIFTDWWAINLIYRSKKKSKRNLMQGKSKSKKDHIRRKQREIFKLFLSSARSLQMRKDAYISCVSHPPFIAGFVDKRRRKVAGNPFEEINGFPQIDVAVESQR